MKKLSLIVVCLLLTLLGFSQDFSRVLKITKSEWKNDNWSVVDTQYPKDLFIIMKDWDIKIGTFKLKTYDEPEKTTYEVHTVYSWKCIDENGEKCTFMMKKFKPEVTTHILIGLVYEQYLTMVEYETEQN